MLAAAFYELWPLWAGLFMELYPRPAIGSRERVWRVLRGGALSVSGAALVVWSQSGGAVSPDGGSGNWLFAAGAVAGLACSCGPLSAAMGLAWARERAAEFETDVWRYVAFWRGCSAFCGVAGSLAAHMLSGGTAAFSAGLGLCAVADWRMAGQLCCGRWRGGGPGGRRRLCSSWGRHRLRCRRYRCGG